MTWTEPANAAAPILAYRILIAEADGDFSEELVSCDGSTSGVYGALECDIPLTTLRAAPYSLAYGALVQARVRA